MGTQPPPQNGAEPFPQFSAHFYCGQEAWNHSNWGGGYPLHNNVVKGLTGWLTELLFYIPLDTKYVISETFPKPISWLGMEKLNLTQQKHTFTSQKKCTTTQNKHKNTKARFSRLLRHPAVASYDIQPGNGEGLFWFRRFINLSLTYLDIYPLTYSSGTHTGQTHR